MNVYNFNSLYNFKGMLVVLFYRQNAIIFVKRFYMYCFFRFGNSFPELKYRNKFGNVPTKFYSFVFILNNVFIFQSYLPKPTVLGTLIINNFLIKSV